MKADYLSFRSATSVSLLGAVIQAVMGLVLLIYGYRGHDHAAVTAAGFILLGLPAWIGLAIVFDQHRRERVEAMEADSLSKADARAASAFEGAREDLRVAAKRLAWLYKWFLPALSLAIGGLLVAWGLFRFFSGQELISPDKFVKPTLVGWGVAIGVGVAVVGFMLGRYVSGMAKQKIWANLRGGAGFAVGAAIFALVLVIGHGAAKVASDAMLRSLVVIFPVIIIVLGAEVFRNFLLDLYLPRKAGETPRAAFESRVLGFVAAPDRIAESISDAINYQLGYNVTTGWLYQLLSRSIWKLAVFGIVVTWALTSLAVVRPDQRGLVLRFGRLVREVGPGLNFKWPWPIERVEIPVYLERDGEEYRITGRTVTGVRVLQVGSKAPDPEGPILWTKEHSTGEEFLVVQPSRVAAATAESTGGPDLALLAIEIPVHYAIKDVRAYERLGSPEMRERLLRAVAQREALRYLATQSVDDMLGPGRAEISAELRRRVTEAFETIRADPTGQTRGAGVEVLFVGVEGVHPPAKDQVADLYQSVVEAEQKTAALVLSAKGTAIARVTREVGSTALAEEIIAELEMLEQIKKDGPPERAAEQELKVQRLVESASGEAAVQILRASGSRWVSHMSARARLEEYRGLLASYMASPGLFRATRYIQTLGEAMQDARVIIAPPDVDIRFDYLEQGVTSTPFDPNAGAPADQQ